MIKKTIIHFFILMLLSSLVSCRCNEKKSAYYTLSIKTVNGSVKAEPDLPQYREGTMVTLTAVADDGFDFSSWTGDLKSGENPVTFVIDGNKEITAGFTVYYTASYYVDYANGSDSNDGLSPAGAWKHAPGDVNAASSAASTQLKPGNRIVFRGGTVYRGQLKIPADGSQNHHITYQGNAWPGLENSRAVIDGGDLVTGWTQCASSADCYGNPDYSNIYYTYLPATADPLSINLHEMDAAGSEDSFLWPSQYPNPSDFYFYDNMEDFRTVAQSNLTRTSITDPDFFNQADAHYWDDSYLLIWTNPNLVVTRKILSYSPADGRVTFEDLGEYAIYPDGRNQSYALFNSPHAIDQAGEYFISTTPDSSNRLKLLLRPRSNVNPDGRITYSARNWGIDIGSHSNITIEGFSVIKHSGSGLHDGIGIGTVSASYLENYNIIIRNNYIAHNRKGDTRGYGGIYLENTYNTLVQDNQLIDNPRNAGIFLSGGARVNVKGNTIDRAGATSLRFYAIEHGIIDGNIIRRSNGSHANGITIYIGSSDILVVNNRVEDCNSPVTFQDSGNLWFINNVVDAGGRDSNVNEWGDTGHGPWERGIISFLNNTLVRNSRNASLNFGNASAENRYISINNIIDGGGAAGTISRSNNLYTGLAWDQGERYGWALSSGEMLQENLEMIFVNPSASDFRLAPGSPAVNAGTDITQYLPVEVFPEFDFTRDINGYVRTGWDIGAFDYR